ncbi:MAG: helix-turn-helix transcriptional regulator [Rubrivivax sp.]|nr:helix-turn-helix transcriptional regulator [Pseudomonadota bacterium]MCW5639255.1 helix-turn-helix transcriptional regulator [Rubrivivax sp.]
MKNRGIQLEYRYGGAGQQGAEVDNPLFDLLSALAAAGSIQQAAVALGLSYRHLWGQLKAWEDRLGEPLVVWARGQPARLTPFAERLLWAERQARVRMAPHIEALRHELQRVLDEALDGSCQVLRVAASHDLLLPTLQVLAAQQQRLHLALQFAGSLEALRLLAQGRCVVAGFHAPLLLDRSDHYAQALKPLLVPGRHKLIGCMRRTQGLMVAPGNPLRIASLADAARRRLRLASREPGSGTHLLAEHLALAAGLDAAASLRVTAVENSHVAVATAVASGRADAALGLEAAARAEGLGFVPLVEEEYFLVCLADTLEQPGLRALREVLASPAWQQATSGRAGYAPAPAAGQVLSLTRALPWWRFRTPRR